MLYGTGITVGAGIYVLIGAVAGHAGVYAPWSFVVAAAVMALTVGSYAELSTRYPVSAGEAAYVRAAFRSRALSTAIGLLTIVTGVVSSAAVTLGSAGYIQQFVDLPRAPIVAMVVLALGAVAAWGILESVVLASLFTLIEVGGLVTIIVAGIHAGLPHCLDDRRRAAAGRNDSVRHWLRQPARLLRIHRIRGPGQCRGGGEGPTPRHPARHDPDAWHFDAPLCPGRSRRRQRRADRTAGLVIGATQSGVSRSRWCQSGDDQRDRHRVDPEHDPWRR